jgi:hypothetical protein
MLEGVVQRVKQQQRVIESIGDNFPYLSSSDTPPHGNSG